jgi:hypothetical protein
MSWVPTEAARDAVSDFEAMIEVADLRDLELMPPVGGNKFSADKMAKKPGRPPVGVQGKILDAMDDGTVTRLQASRLLDLVQLRLRGDGPGLSVVDDGGNLTPLHTTQRRIG